MKCPANSGNLASPTARYDVMRFLIMSLVLAVTALAPSYAAKTIEKCTFRKQTLFGKVQIVDTFPDFKVKVVESFPDLKVQRVSTFPDKCGKWQIVTSFPDFTIQFVQSFPDFTIQYVETFPGEP